MHTRIKREPSLLLQYIEELRNEAIALLVWPAVAKTKPLVLGVNRVFFRLTLMVMVMVIKNGKMKRTGTFSSRQIAAAYVYIVSPGIGTRTKVLKKKKTREKGEAWEDQESSPLESLGIPDGGVAEGLLPPHGRRDKRTA